MTNSISIRHRANLFRALLVALLLWASAPGVLAQAEVDPVARQYATQLYPYYLQGVQAGNWAPFIQACSADPVMTKKMFITVLQYSGEQAQVNPAAAQDALGYSRVLAKFINDSFGDPGPLTILQGVDAGRPILELQRLTLKYALPLYPELQQAKGSPAFAPINVATQKYGEYEVLPALMDDEDLALYRPLYQNFLKIQLTVSFALLDQGIQQVDEGTRLIQATKAKLNARSYVAPWTESTLGFFQTGLDTYKLAIYSELGLLQAAEQKLPSVLDKPDVRNYRSGVLLACARTALAQGKTAAAADFLRRSREKLQGFVAPPLEYALRTVDYQVRRQSGYEPSPREKVQEFEKAWKAFEGYRPFQRVHADGFWYYGRKATRFWLEEFEPGTPESTYVGDSINKQVMGWLANPLPALPGTSDDWFFNSEQTGNLFTAFIAMVEQVISVREAELATKTSSSNLADLTKILNLVVESLPAYLGVEQSAPGGPEFDLAKGGLYRQLLGRIHLLEARDPSLSPAKRLAAVEKGVSFILKSEEPDTAIDSLLSAGLICQQLGRSDLAIENWKEALARAESLNYVEQATEASSLLAKEYSQSAKWQEATVYADKASANMIASVGLVAGDAGATRRLNHNSQRATEVSVKSAAQSDDPQQAQKALAAVVRGKETQSAAAQMSGQGEAKVQVMAVAKQEQEVAALAVQVQSLESMPASATRNELLQSSQKLLAETKAEFLLKSREIRQKYPDLYSRVLKFDPLDLPGVQKTLPAEAAVIQYFPTDEGLYVFLVTRESFRLRSVPITEKQLDQSVASFVRGVRRAQHGDSQLEKESKALYAALIEPCQADIEGKSILVLIPAGRLNILPFACLTAPSGAPLIESKLILEMAQPTDFMRISTDPPRKVESVVAFANATGDLPAAGKEGDQIAAMFPGAKLFKGKEASKQNFLDFGADAQVLHLATHGESNSENSLTNYLKMSGNEKIAQEEIFGLTFDNTSIVTLSACNTAVGDNLDSKFVASLAEAFWLGGSQSVIASLWAVNDASTGLLMTEFYQGLRAGKGKALALKDAQLKVRSTPGYEHPYFWAGFLLFGDWR